MKQFRLNIHAAKEDNSMSEQKNRWKTALTRTTWAAPTLGVGIAATLVLFTIAHSGQAQTSSTTTLQTILQHELAFLSVLPQPVIDPATDPPGNFTNVIPKQFDPGKTNLVQATWLSGIGCPTNATIALPNGDFTGVGSFGTFMDPACPIGFADANDQRNQGLLLVKTGPTITNFAAATAELINVKGMTLSELGYDIRKFGSLATGTSDMEGPLGSHCGAGAPRFDVVTTDGMVHFVGCISPPAIATTGGSTGWIRLRWGAAQLEAASPPILPGNVVSRIVIVFDEGQDASGGPDMFGAAILDNIDVNGTLVGRGPVNAN